ncbi:hypothetical protein HDU98_010346 [Podochytrium sp. JEL0797]|nr:hypothetical protein HDU98_010346 [Podochytrium sp. JEL0797]
MKTGAIALVLCAAALSTAQIVPNMCSTSADCPSGQTCTPIPNSNLGACIPAAPTPPIHCTITTLSDCGSDWTTRLQQPLILGLLIGGGVLVLICLPALICCVVKKTLCFAVRSSSKVAVGVAGAVTGGGRGDGGRRGANLDRRQQPPTQRDVEENRNRIYGSEGGGRGNERGGVAGGGGGGGRKVEEDVYWTEDEHSVNHRSDRGGPVAPPAGYRGAQKFPLNDNEAPPLPRSNNPQQRDPNSRGPPFAPRDQPNQFNSDNSQYGGPQQPMYPQASTAYGYPTQQPQPYSAYPQPQQQPQPNPYTAFPPQQQTYQAPYTNQQQFQQPLYPVITPPTPQFNPYMNQYQPAPQQQQPLNYQAYSQPTALQTMLGSTQTPAPQQLTTYSDSSPLESPSTTNASSQVPSGSFTAPPPPAFSPSPAPIVSPLARQRSQRGDSAAASAARGGSGGIQQYPTTNPPVYMEQEEPSPNPSDDFLSTYLADEDEADRGGSELSSLDDEQLRPSGGVMHTPRDHTIARRVDPASVDPGVGMKRDVSGSGGEARRSRERMSGSGSGAERNGSVPGVVRRARTSAGGGVEAAAVGMVARARTVSGGETSAAARPRGNERNADSTSPSRPRSNDRTIPRSSTDPNPPPPRARSTNRGSQNRHSKDFTQINTHTAEATALRAQVAAKRASRELVGVPVAVSRDRAAKRASWGVDRSSGSGSDNSRGSAGGPTTTSESTPPKPTRNRLSRDFSQANHDGAGIALRTHIAAKRASRELVEPISVARERALKRASGGFDASAGGFERELGQVRERSRERGAGVARRTSGEVGGGVARRTSGEMGGKSAVANAVVREYATTEWEDLGRGRQQPPPQVAAPGSARAYYKEMYGVGNGGGVGTGVAGEVGAGREPRNRSRVREV